MSKECYRCSHKWVARTAERPKNCPKCKSPYWDKPRVRGLTPAKEVEDTVEELWNEYAVPSHPVGKEPKLRVGHQMTDPSTGYVFVDLVEDKVERDFDWGP